MNENSENRALQGELPRISQELSLTCRQCGKSEAYDVGTILCNPERKTGADYRDLFFANYFRCRHCGSPGPWDLDDFVTVMGLASKAKMDREFPGLRFGRTSLFDGTIVQTPAMGEQHLLDLIQKDPGSAFLCTRLANLLRNCGQDSKAAPWYAKALELDPNEIEARHHQYIFALRREDIPAALRHMLVLVRSLLEGWKTSNKEFNEYLARSVAEDLRKLPEPFRKRFLQGPETGSHPKEEIFIRSLLSQQGDEGVVVTEAAQRLLSGRPKPDKGPSSPEPSGKSTVPGLDLFPSLRTLVECAGMNPEKLTVAFETDGQGHIRLVDRHTVCVADANKMVGWKVPSLAELFRGNKLPPPDIDHYPPEYAPHFHFIEAQLLTLCDAVGDRPDQEMEELYTSLRKRPDGRSLGEVHDFLWQVTALLLGTRVVSGPEYQGILGALVGSTRRWGVRPVSRNYAIFLRKTLRNDPRWSIPQPP